MEVTWSLLVLLVAYVHLSSCENEFYYVKHSMTAEMPRCNPNTILMWGGYSYMGPDTNSDKYGRGTCVGEFSTVPLTWDYLDPSKVTYWLGTGHNIEAESPIKAKSMLPHISRCMVCQTDNIIKTIHAKKKQKIKCGKGWKALWSGFTYLTHNSSSLGDKKSHLKSHASCLPGLRENPVVKCDMLNDQCWTDTPTHSYWSVDGKHEDSKDILSAHHLKKRAGRCLVCLKDGYYQVDKDNEADTTKDQSTDHENKAKGEKEIKKEAKYDAKNDHKTGESNQKSEAKKEKIDEEKEVKDIEDQGDKNEKEDNGGKSEKVEDSHASDSVGDIKDEL